MADQKSKLLTKISPLIEGQVPDFIQSEHPLFVKFLKDYYQFLEAGQINYSSDIDYIIQETTTVAYINEEEFGDRIVTESGAGSTGKFTNGETITGSTSSATATVLVEDSRNFILYVSSQQKFITDETITGGTSGATATLTEYRANPVQNIQQLLEYANTDNTIFDFLDKMSISFMNAIPNSLATSVSKRKLIKNIKDLYSAKGTKEGHELFMRILLGEESEIFYPNKHMLRTSAGDWRTEITLRCTAFQGVAGDEVVNQVITGQSSGATATVNDTITFQEGAFSVTELELANIVGTFTDGEIIKANSITRDVDVSFTIESIVSTATVSNDGILHTDQETLSIENLGNNKAELIVEGITQGTVSGIIVDDVGSLYEVGDDLTFTSSESDVKTAAGFVSMVGGGILQEAGTLDDSDITTDTIILEVGTKAIEGTFNITLETQQSDSFTGDGETTAFTLTNTSAATDTLYVTLDNVKTTAWTAVTTTLTFTDAPGDGVRIWVRGNEVDNLLLDGTDGSSTNAGHTVITDTVETQPDTYGTNSDNLVLEFGTFANLSATAESGAIRKLFLKDGGSGYTDLPTITVTSTTGTGTKLLAITKDIGATKSIKIKNTGFDYSAGNPPDITLRGHFVIKDVTGTFAESNTLTTHVGTVQAWDSDTQVLDTTFENVIRVEQEQTGTFQEGIQLEQGTQIKIPHRIILEDEQDFSDGVNIILDGTGTTTASAQVINHRVLVAEVDDQNYFYIGAEKAPVLTLHEGNTYYFDLSDSSLYHATASSNHNFKFSITSDGTHGSGSAYTTGVTTSASTISIGTSGAYIQIVVASGAPTLYYYCANHSGMGNIAYTAQQPTTIDNAGDNILLNGESKNEFKITLEDETNRGSGSGVFALEDGSGDFLTEPSILNFVQHEGSNLLLNRYHENDKAGSQAILLDGTNSSSADAGDALATEDFGNILILDGTDTDSSDATSGFLLDDETGDGDVVLDGTDSSSTDAADNIINESGIDFSNNDVTITDSGGATGTIVNADIATGSTTVATTSTSTGAYAGVESLLGEDLIRLQDSYYYQDFSYEVRIGASLSSYLNELKKAVHPAGFKPFGKVTVATELAVRIATTAAGVADFTGDDTFTPELASVLETIFDQTFQRRLRADNQGIGHRDDKIIYETGSVAGDKLILDATSSSTGSTTPSSVSILLEDNLQPSGYDYDVAYLILDSSAVATDIGGKIDVESGSLENEYEGFMLEENNIILEYATDGGFTDRLVLNGTDGSSTNADSYINLDEGLTEYLGMEDGHISTGSRILYEDYQVTTNEVNSGIMKAETAHDGVGGLNDTTLAHQLVTKLSVKPATRDTRNLFITLGKTPFEFENPLGGIQLENTVKLIYEDATHTDDTGNNESVPNDGIKLESGVSSTGDILIAERETKRVVYDNLILNGTPPLETNYFIVLNGTDSSSSNAGDNVVLEGEYTIDTARLTTEDSVFSHLSTVVRDSRERIIIDDETNDSTLQLTAIGSYRFLDIVRKDKIIFEEPDGINPLDYRSLLTLEGGEMPIALETETLDDSNVTTDFIQIEDNTASDGKYTNGGQSETSNANAVDAVGVLMEDFGYIILNGTSSGGSNSGDALLQETDKRNKFITEASGSLVVEDFSTSSILDLILLESGTGQMSGHDHINVEDAVSRDEKIADGFLLEEGTGETIGSNLVLNGTDSDSTNAGDKVLAQINEDELKQNPRSLALETTNVFVSEGTIPFGNWTLNTTDTGFDPVINQSVITLTDAGDIALEDSTDSSSGFIVLNGTDSSSTNAGSQFDLETATLKDVIANAI